MRHEKLYTESDTWCPSMDGLEFARIEEARIRERFFQGGSGKGSS